MNGVCPNIYHTQVNDFYVTWLKYRYQVGFVPSIIVSRNGKDKLSAAGMQRIIKSNKMRLVELVNEPIDSVMLQCAIKHMTNDKNFTKYYDQFRRLFIVTSFDSQTINTPFLEKLIAYGYDYSTIFAKLYLHDGCATSLRFILQSSKTVCEFPIKSTTPTTPITAEDSQILKIHTKQLAILSTMTRRDTYFSWLPGDIKIMIFAMLPRGCLLLDNLNLPKQHRTLNRKECGCMQWDECLCASEWDCSDTDCECADDETRARITNYIDNKRELDDNLKQEHDINLKQEWDDFVEQYGSRDLYISGGVNCTQKNAIALSAVDLDEDLSLMDYVGMSSLVTAPHE